MNAGVGAAIGAIAALLVLTTVIGLRRARRVPVADAHQQTAHTPLPRKQAAPSPGSADRVYRVAPPKDRRSLWARRYGAGGASIAATWTAGTTGLQLTKKDGVGDSVARCSGSAGLIGGCGAGGACGGGVSGCVGGFGGGCGGGAGCGGGGCGGGGCGGS